MLAQFPEFQRIQLENKAWYDEFSQGFPSLSDLSFATLMMWWDFGNSLEMSLLNDNLVIHYQNPRDPDNSGYAIVGTNMLEESFSELFAFLAEKGLPVRAVHEPEFILKALSGHPSFLIENERDYDEYILDAHDLMLLDKPEHSRTRRKVRRFIREAGEQTETVLIDLNSETAKDLVLTALNNFTNGGQSHNDPEGEELTVIKKCVMQADTLSIQCLAAYVHGVIQGIALYHVSRDGKYYIVNHIKVNDVLPHIFDYVTQQLAERAVKENVPFLNFEMDLGIPGLRFHKMGLHPVDFHKKYRIAPVLTTS